VRIVRTALTATATVALAAVPVVLLAPTSAGAATADFTDVGTTTWTVPDGVSCVTVTAIGAEGGSYPEVASDVAAQGNGNGPGAAVAGDGAAGGSGSSELAVLPGTELQINVGGRGGDADSGPEPVVGGAGGFNGGGDGGSPTVPNSPNGYWAGAGGGGASDVRIGGTALENRVVVGGGGSGFGGFFGDQAAVGGGDTGADAPDYTNATGGTGGTQSAGGVGGSTNVVGKTGVDGTFGQGGTGGGGDAVDGGGGGGGGGWYGGGGGGGVRVNEAAAAPGGGGSGFGDDLVQGVDAENDGNGRVTIEYEVGDTSCLAAPLTITKSTTGAAAHPGEVYTMTVSCETASIDFAGQDLQSVELPFGVDASGVVQPASGYTLGFTGPNQCTVTETGASTRTTATSYSCTGSGAEEPIDVIEGTSWTGGVGAATAANPDDPCATSGPQATPITVDIVNPDQVASVAVTNTLADPAAAIVNVTPRFTG
jgi:hypothetical protein